MPDESSGAKNELIKASVEVVKVAYDDALKPVAQQAGKALGTLGATINVALAPLRGLVWSWDKIEEWITETVEKKLFDRGVPEERIQTPDPDIAVPVIEALRYTRLKEQYANLLATSMDSATATEAHPGFVEILKQLTPDEARIIQFLPSWGRSVPIADVGYSLPEKGEFIVHKHLSNIASDAGCADARRTPQLLDNLCRLGLTDVPAMRRLAELSRYDRLRADECISKLKSQLPPEATFLFVEKMFGLTLYGEAFRKACIVP